MAVTLNTALSTHRSSANKVQKQKFGTYYTAITLKDALAAERRFGDLKDHDAIKRIDEALVKEDNIGKKVLQLFRDHITGSNKN